MTAPSSDPFRVLVVCLGNVCRSPFIERLLRLRLGQADGAFEVTSAGVRAMVGRGIHSDTAEQLVALGGQAEGFVSRQLTAAHVTNADLVLVATQELRSAVLQEAPAGLRRTFTLREFAALAVSSEAATLSDLVSDASKRRSTVDANELDVPDPMGRPPEAHAASAAIAAEAVDRLARVLLRLTGVQTAN